MGRRQVIEEPPVDNTAWLIDSSFAEFLLISTVYVKYMAMFGKSVLNHLASNQSMRLGSAWIARRSHSEL